MEFSLIERIYKFGKEIPNKICVIDSNRSYTYKDLYDSILKKQLVLKNEYGVRKGDKVLLAAVKDFDFISSYYAIHWLQAISIPIDKNSSSDFLINLKKQTKIRISINIDIPGVKRVKDFSNFILQIEPDINPNFPNLDSIADYMFTSGTSLQAKGVILTHRNIISATDNINNFIGNNKNDTEILVVPLHHSFGMARLRCVISVGGTLVLVKNLVNIKRIFRIFSEIKITGIGMVPSAWSYLKKMSANKIIELFKNLRYIEFGSAFMSEAEKKNLVSLFPKTKICMHYGLTEASRSCFLDFKSDYDFLYTVGTPNANTQIITIDPVKKLKLENGQIGEICIAGPHVSKGYVNSNSENMFYNEFVRTGDLGYIDSNGYIILEGRLKEMINVGGKKISPLEIENKIYEFNNNIISACIGVKDKNNILGEVVKVFIQKNSYDGSFEEISDYLEKNLERHKVPVSYEFIDKIPHTSSGKIMRNKLI